jgi:hypothetical protein
VYCTGSLMIEEQNEERSYIVHFQNNFEDWTKKSRHLHGGLNSIWSIRFLRKMSGGFDRDLQHEIHDDPNVAPVQLCPVREGHLLFYTRHIIH